jgi:outer membrane protein assembly factor BamA
MITQRRKGAKKAGKCLKLLAAFAILLSGGLGLQTFRPIQAQDTAPLVETVQVVGHRRRTTKEILAHIKTRPGDRLSEEQIRRDLREVLAMGVFDALESRVISEPGSRGGFVVTFELVELPLLLEVKFNRLRGIDESGVLRVFHERGIDLVKGSVYDPVKIRIAKGILKELLASRGWPETVITVRSETADGNISIEFEIRYDEQ